MSILDKVRPNPSDQCRRILAKLIWYNTRHEETSGNKERENGVGALVQEQLAQMLWYWR